MKLKNLVEQYIDYRKSLGEKCYTNAKNLRFFCNFIGMEILVKNISPSKVHAFLYKNGAVTSGWFVRHTSLLGFYNYAICRGYIKKNPLPKILPKRPSAFIPYIYSKEELRLILDTSLAYQQNRSLIEPQTVRAILLLLYGTGMRVSEALALKLGDVDLHNMVLTVRETKFFKSRLIPFNKQLLKVIRDYLIRREKIDGSQNIDSPFFISLKSRAICIGTMREIFKRIRKKAGIKRIDNASFQPRLHDLRHTFAVHRLTSWYQENKDVQKLLPILSTYLGHTRLAATSVYLTMTGDLLHEAGSRFQQYAIGDLQ